MTHRKRQDSAELMRELPPGLEPYRRTPTFNQDTVPAGLLKAHQTKPATWAKIVVLKGELAYRILEPHFEEVHLSPGMHGVVEPTVRHEVQPMGDVMFYVQFYRART